MYIHILYTFPYDIAFHQKETYSDDICEVWPEGRRTSRPAVLVFTDVFGWRSGRTRQICDQIAAQVGAQVVLPNFFYQDWDWGS